ncbi:MAG: 16S rRNA (guanine(966)-N(2))-methyltransferase RsmD [Pleurocapsa minor GSE-CHR-MK-17-07R]|jgi:16S rRNA (guanine(966)-N(2))-methyltransferase RsmD|nr:16S rRNA (guanine(966)-N(2))-methyltransferase RsmD [Pleurocapsa minor GSE-CHR-MK 17-07R]
MSIRVIAGTARGRQLKLVPGDTTRPIMDRVKEALFNIIGPDIYDTAFLDVFSGTGSVGIEALSRGAKSATLLDLEKKAVDTIKENLRLTRLEDRADVRRADAFSFLSAVPYQAFDYVYIAPPQYAGMWLKAVQLVDDQPGWVAPEGSIIIQIDPSELVELTLRHFSLYDQRKYGSTLLLFLEHTSGQAE